jgi:CubicO group peptidase (beta-lactamase class C family)
MSGSVWSGGRPDKIFAYSWESTVRDMARVGLLLLRGGVWDGKRILSEEWVNKLTHPAFEDANTAYGYLTWMVANSNWSFGGILNEGKYQAPLDSCAPPALWPSYPHGISGAANCNYEGPYACTQQHDVGVWYAAGALGQYIAGHKGLDLVLVVKDLGSAASSAQLWSAVRPALVALDPKFAGDEQAFCQAYSTGSYAPDL